MAYIDIIDSTGNDFRYQLPEDGSVLLIGSAEDCSISLPHIADLLPQHCTISLQPEGYVITAAAPGAPLLAEGQPTEAAVLVPHAVYNLGSTMLMYNDAAIAAAPVAEEAPAAETEEAIVEEPAKPEKKKKKK
ncbi:MAG: FHA domain-containing protein, partial [Akkermansia sp.]|nr:FHA domain-containing protein [Akkermansia sp.]